mgnify:CR=1 FL=1
MFLTVINSQMWSFLRIVAFKKLFSRWKSIQLVGTTWVTSRSLPSQRPNSSLISTSSDEHKFYTHSERILDFAMLKSASRMKNSGLVLCILILKFTLNIIRGYGYSFSAKSLIANLPYGRFIWFKTVIYRPNGSFAEKLSTLRLTRKYKKMQPMERSFYIIGQREFSL